MVSNIIIIVAIAVVVILVIILTGYVKAPADKAYIISGPHKDPKILIGRAGIKIPFLERKDVLLLKQISIDIKTNGFVPTKDFIGVDIDAVAKVRVMTEDITLPNGNKVSGITLAAKNFLNMDEKGIATALTDSLQGNMREIIGTIELRELNTDRKQFGDQVQEKAQIDMNALGIEIISCNIQSIKDEQNLINALGQDNMSKIQKDASIAKANADRDVAIAQAEAARESNDAQVASETVIAEKNNELDIKKAELKKASDIKKAEADAAYKIQAQEQLKSIQTATVNAEIAKAEREAELRKQEVAVQEETLNAQVRKKAEADRYAVEQQAAADLTKRQRDAEAQLYEQQKAAEAKKAEADALRYNAEQEAAGIRAKGEAEAAAIKAKGEAEAAAMDKKAEAMKKYGQAAITQMIVDKLPEMAEAVARPYEKIDKITVISGGNDNDGTGSIGGYVPTALAKTMESVKEATGIDLKDLIEANGKEAKVTRNINITGVDDADKDVKDAIVSSAVTKAEDDK